MGKRLLPLTHKAFLFMEEIFKDIPNYEDMYQVSNLGNVKSLGNNKNRKDKILKISLDGSGYKKVSLCKNSKIKTIRVHQLVSMAFLNHKINGHKLSLIHI